MAYVGLFMFIARLGFEQAHIKRVSEGQDLKKCIGTFFVVKVVLITLMICVVLASIVIWKYVIGKGFQTAEHEQVIYIFLAYYALMNLSAVPLSTFIARREVAKQQFPSLMDHLVRVPLIIIIAVGSYGVIALASTYLIGVIALFVTAMFLFRFYPFGRFDSTIFRSYFKFAILISVSTSIAIINKNIDKVMLQLFWGAYEVGNYFAVQKITEFLIFMSTAITILLIPTLSKHHGKSNNTEIKRLTRTAERYVSLVVTPCAVILIVMSWPILNLFNEKFANDAQGILPIMAIFSYIFCLYLVFINQIMAVNRPGIAAMIGISMAIINITLNLILIPRDIKILGVTLFGLGAIGAALATMISKIIGLTMSKIAVRRLTGTKTNLKILLHMCAGVVMGGSLYLINLYITHYFFPIESVFIVVPICLLGLGIYVGVLWLVREFTRDDFKLFMNILNPKEMKQYVVSELRDKEKKT
jgi:O-antigen/teichoic acid export membrane protein